MYSMKLSLFSKKPVTGQNTPPPSPHAQTDTAGQYIGKERLGQVIKAGDATALRAVASQGVTVAALSSGAYWTGSAMSNPIIRATVASAVGVSVVMPVLMPALIGVLVATLFVLRQKGLNEELATNLYFIKMEVERMYRIHNVLKDITDEKGINLHTTNLANCMKGLQSNIMKFSSKDTIKKIKEFEMYLIKGDLISAENLINAVEQEARDETRKQLSAAATAAGTKSIASKMWSTIRYPFRTLPTGFSSRWLSPDETLRQIIRDITIATVWFSIMLGEERIFERYMDIKGSKVSNEWINKKAFKDMLLANKQLGTTTNKINNSSNSKYVTFYSHLEGAKATAAQSIALHPNSAKQAVEEITVSQEVTTIVGLPEVPEVPKVSGEIPTGGRRATKRQRAHMAKTRSKRKKTTL